MTEDAQRLFNGVLPLDDVESGAIDLAGRFAEFVDRLQAAARFASPKPKPIAAWAEALADAADSLTATTDRDAWQHAELQRLLEETVATATSTADERRRRSRSLNCKRSSPTVCAGRPTRANFRTGHLTICTLVPMRSVPHRVVCLLGLDDGVFPRKSFRDGDDLMLDDPHVGDRDPRSEDRQTAARRAARGRGSPDPHLHRKRRADERAASAGGARRGTARRHRCNGPHPDGGRTRLRSWCGTRCSPSTRATSSPTN